ncbi:hypothetical protein KIH75_09505, partial [Bifidobacterium sp. 64T4]|uniref:lipid II flippase MurJ n=1 Tax=Bifidobacterium pongonis TaxID=2834432 RepID=UPI00237B9F93
QERLNKLITVSITLLLAMTLLMMAGTPLLTMLYLDSSWGPAQRALVNSFTLWCMPQIFFYGLYTVLGQLLAAKDNFGAYAWSSVGANLISCAGFVAFLILFGRASHEPMSFWTTDKVMLSAGTWTLGVAFQALVLFIPLFRLGFKYKPKWGIRGIGLRSMGPVAAWSLGITGVQEVANIVNARITNGAPFAGNDLYGIAGNSSYQNAFTLYILPYSLIAVSVSTAIFPKISRAVASNNLDEARADLSGSLRNIGVMMMFFTAVYVVMPAPIIIALLPSVGLHDAQLIAGPMMMLALALPFASAYLLIQRTFYAFEDGLRPFLFQLVMNVIQIIFSVACAYLLPPQYWASCVGLAVTVGYAFSFPMLVVMLRRRFNGNLDGRRIAKTYIKAFVAAFIAIIAGLLFGVPILSLLHASLTNYNVDMNWFQAVAFCALMAILMGIVYAGALIVMRCEEFVTIVKNLRNRFLRKAAATAETAAMAETTAETAAETAVGSAAEAALETSVQEGQEGEASAYAVPQETAAERPSAKADGGVENPLVISPTKTSQTAVGAAAVSTSPTARMTPASTHSALQSSAQIGVENMTKPQLGDTLFNRYTLIALLRDEPGVQAWKANDRVLARDCQVFILTAAQHLGNVAVAASTLGRVKGFTPVVQFRKAGDAAVLITDVESGLSLTDYLQGQSGDVLGTEAIRSIIGSAATLAGRLMEPRLSTSTLRISTNGLEIADTAIASMLEEPSQARTGMHGDQLVIRQLAALLYALITKTPSSKDMVYDLRRLDDNVPSEFRMIIIRGLAIDDGSHRMVPMASLSELTALLGDWTPLDKLPTQDIVLPSAAGEGSIVTAELCPVDEQELVELPASVITTEKLRELTIEHMPQPRVASSTANEQELLKKGEANLSKLANSTEKTLSAVLHKSQESEEALKSRLNRPIRHDAKEYSDADLFEGFAFSSDSMTAVGDNGFDMTTQIPAVDDANYPTQAIRVSDVQNDIAHTAQPAAAPAFVPAATPAPAEQPASYATAQPADDMPMQQPPSFAPQAKANEDVEEANDDLADTRLFGKYTTATVVVAAAAVVVLIALGIALTAMHVNSNSNNPDSSNEWSDSNIDNVPFGDENETDGNNDSSSQSSSSSAAGDDGYDYIDVTDMFSK